jgi:hypothetical protein
LRGRGLPVVEALRAVRDRPKDDASPARSKRVPNQPPPTTGENWVRARARARRRGRALHGRACVGRPSRAGGEGLLSPLPPRARGGEGFAASRQARQPRSRAAAVGWPGPNCAVKLCRPRRGREGARAASAGTWAAMKESERSGSNPPARAGGQPGLTTLGARRCGRPGRGRGRERRSLIHASGPAAGRSGRWAARLLAGRRWNGNAVAGTGRFARGSRGRCERGTDRTCWCLRRARRLLCAVEEAALAGSTARRFVALRARGAECRWRSAGGGRK